MRPSSLHVLVAIEEAVSAVCLIFGFGTMRSSNEVFEDL